MQGICNAETEHFPLFDTTMTLSKSVDIARGREAATKEVEGLGHFSNIHTVMDKNKLPYAQNKNACHSSNKSTTSKPSQTCSGCGKNHWKTDCHFKDAECFQCKKKRHISKVRRNKGVKDGNSTNSYKFDQNNFITSNSDQASSRKYDEVFCVQGLEISPINMNLFLNGLPV